MKKTEILIYNSAKKNLWAGILAGPQCSNLPIYPKSKLGLLLEDFLD